MKNYPLSLRVMLFHTGFVVVALLLMISPLGHKPGAIHPLLILPFFYLIFSGITYAYTMIRGIYEIRTGGNELGSKISVFISIIILVTMSYGVYYMWPRWMSV